MLFDIRKGIIVIIATWENEPTIVMEERRKNYSQKYIMTTDNLMRKEVGIHLSGNDSLRTPM